MRLEGVGFVLPYAIEEEVAGFVARREPIHAINRLIVFPGRTLPSQNVDARLPVVCAVMMDRGAVFGVLGEGQVSFGVAGASCSGCGGGRQGLEENVQDDDFQAVSSGSVLFPPVPRRSSQHFTRGFTLYVRGWFPDVSVFVDEVLFSELGRARAVTHLTVRSMFMCGFADFRVRVCS